jgi:hypothetical protein
VTGAVNRFYNSIKNAGSQSQSALVELFVYFLTVEAGQESVTPKQVIDCFVHCDLSAPKNVAARLSEGLTGKPPRFIKTNGGYKLQRHAREALSLKLGVETATAQTSASLRSLEHKLPEGQDKDFLKEAIDCFEVGANRATIVMAWILAIDHLFAYILTHKLQEFNVVTQRDDFTEMKESKFIEFCCSAKIISNDVRKILEQKLDTRNSSARPSGITINRSKVIDFVEDLIDNVVLKYQV